MKHLLAIALAALSQVAHADPMAHVQFRKFGVEQGLQNLSINQVAQSADGLLWVATEDGLYRYDGTRFQRFGTTEGLPANNVVAIGAAGREMWVGTTRGVALVAGNHVVRQIATDAVTGLAVAGDRVWVATDTGLLHKLGDGLTLLPGWPGGASGAVWAGEDGRVVASRGRDVVTVDPQGHATEHAFGREQIDAIARTPDGTMWIRSARYLWACDDAIVACRDASAELPDVSEVGRLLVDHLGTLWVTTRSGLAHRTGPARWELLGSEQGVPARSVLDAFEDREGSLWLVGDELYQALGRGLWGSYTAEGGFPSDTVWSVMRDRAGTIWVGSNRGVVEATDGERPWTIFPGTEDFSIRAVVEADAGTMYAAATTVLRLDLRTRTVTSVGPDARFLGAREGVMSLLYDRGTLWVAPARGGLLRMTEDDGQTTWQREAIAGGSDREAISQLILDRAGRLWAAGSEGLAVRDGGTWRRFTERDGLAARSTAYLVERGSGELCVAYTEAHGLSCFRYDGGLAHLQHLTHASGLTSDKIYLLGEDPRGRLYVGMGIGVDVMTGSAIEHFSTASGLAGDDCAATAFHAGADGTVLIGTTRGVERFASASYTGGPAPPTPILLGILLGGAASLDPAHVHAPGAGATSLTVNFATPTFVNRPQLEQQVRLQPLEREWRTTTVGEARYAQLPPGDYVFEIRSRIAPAAYGPVVGISFTVEPAWWQTTAFRTVVAIGILGLLAVAIAWRARVITARAARRIVERSEMSFRALIEQSPDALLVHRDGILVYVNQRTVTYLGYDRADELIGRPVVDIAHGDEQALATERLRVVRDTGKPSDAREFRMRRRDGGTVTAELSSLVVDFAGSPAVLSIARDCGERKALEARLMLADRMASIGTLAAGIAHEINNPLAYVRSNLVLIAEELGPLEASSVVGAALGDAIEGATRVKNIVRGLKTFSRADQEQRTPIDVQRALDMALRITANEIRHRCRIDKAYGPVPVVMGDESRLGQVFINLLVNAAHAIPEGRGAEHAIRIATSTDAHGRAVIEIRDTGCGMSPEIVKRVFDPFFTTKSVGEGTGLGLAICLGIVKAHEGEISVASTPGAGSTFRVVLPSTSRAVEVAAPKVESAPAGASRKVLLIDDDDRLRESLGRMLGKEHAVTLAKSARDALSQLEAGAKFDVIVSDLMMPEMTGMQLHDELVRRLPEHAQHMVFMTGGAFTSEARSFVDRLAHLCIEKPFELPELRRLIRSVA